MRNLVYLPQLRSCAREKSGAAWGPPKWGQGLKDFPVPTWGTPPQAIAAVDWAVQAETQQHAQQTHPQINTTNITPHTTNTTAGLGPVVFLRHCAPIFKPAVVGPIVFSSRMH